ncbi:3'-5' exonuclease [Pseudoroseomonas wenyumeiae]|uniref:3'-5' exonuclease n=1 Tax=Teichococcus wenyumeiae TaxID=2478470 RepID=A0A3A9JD28_9PROT|nr:3'-5' exonuclease [Pseudoroseomonas wenyumeiae]RKK05227.1 3'-5' exonuclease [Pseudoroseomonas wenyumeiae]RMI19903.1 3'-5' exonuclease [Pseudoroseomonas wenyumeiae]
MPHDAVTAPDLHALEEMAALLEASGQYRVLRRVRPHPQAAIPDGTRTRLGLLLDLETTGLDPLRDEIIEIAMLPFTYGLDGTVYSVGEAFSQLRQPSVPIPPAITALTGLTDEMVAGHSIDPAEVARFIEPAALMIAHNAGFDRRFAEAFCGAFAEKPWACSLKDVDWAAEGFEGSRLGYLAMKHGLFFDGHRAVHDCQATLQILARPLLRSGVTGLARLLENARRPSWRIWAAEAPFHHKDTLKARGYRWNGEANEHPRAWYIDVVEGAQAAECAFLCESIYGREVEPPMRRFTAYERFSVRG